MKFYLIIFLFFIRVSIFGQIFPKEDSVKMTKESEKKIWVQQRQRDLEEQCSLDSLNAVEDSKIINKYFINIAVPHGSNFPAKEELETALKKLGIVWGGTWMGNCIGAYTTNSCYYTYMNKFTKEKFGENVINNLIRQTLLDYIDKKPSAIFEYNDHLDWLYENNDAIADHLINLLFFKKFIYPKGYKKSLNKNQSFTKVHLIFDDTSHSLKPDYFEHQIDDRDKQKYISYFERKIRDFINSSIFVLSEHAGRYYGVKTSFVIYYK